MQTGKLPILFILFIYLGAIGFKGLHPLYHAYEHASAENIPGVQAASPKDCSIDLFQFDRKIRFDMEATHISESPVLYTISSLNRLSPLTGYLLHYLLRAPPWI